MAATAATALGMAGCPVDAVAVAVAAGFPASAESACGQPLER